MYRLSAEETAAALKTFGLDRPSGSGFAFRDDASSTRYDWHAHDYHQLIYATDSAIQIESRNACHLLPPGGAAWIPAHASHRTLLAGRGGASLFLAPNGASCAGGEVRSLSTSPVMREMILHALRWPWGEAERDPVARSFFQTFALMCDEWLRRDQPFGFPKARHAGICRAMDYAFANLATASQSGASTAAAMSERSFRRRFTEETGVSWQAWIAQTRILSAMAMLAEGRRVTEIAADVGYASLSAFAQAFTRSTGERPGDYRRRLLGRTSDDGRDA
ncbi:MAG TPA: helix-turn-helix transcriptional regulator [Methylosinus sp.]|jgi:AraC-like DNA-binding protein|uniref:AraC family transcriptional regulator n=1 Tax=Methylosinus sp. TaxID=427 RepID=UPI002F91E19F